MYAFDGNRNQRVLNAVKFVVVPPKAFCHPKPNVRATLHVFRIGRVPHTPRGANACIRISSPPAAPPSSEHEPSQLICMFFAASAYFVDPIENWQLFTGVD